jgi:hypothetical protein
MSRVLCAGSLAHDACKWSPDDHQSECGRQQAASHPSQYSEPLGHGAIAPNEFRSCSRGWLLSLMLFALSACSSPTSPSSEITRERAIELARQHVPYEPTSSAADTDSRLGRPVWVVTFRRADSSHGGLGQFAEVTLDRRTGQIVSVAMS